MSTPGSGGPLPPEQDPRQSGRPASWGQQPPAGQPYPGQHPPAGQQPWGAPQQPTGAQPFGATGAQAHGQPQEQQKPKRKWLPILGAVLAALVVLAALTSFLGGGDPEVGDCIKPDGTSFEKVDCDDDEAEARIVGTDDEMTGEEFDAADVNGLCTETPSATVVLWSGTDESEDGKVFCAEPV